MLSNKFCLWVSFEQLFLFLLSHKMCYIPFVWVCKAIYSKLFPRHILKTNFTSFLIFNSNWGRNDCRSRKYMLFTINKIKCKYAIKWLRVPGSVLGFCYQWIMVAVAELVFVLRYRFGYAALELRHTDLLS